MNIQILKIIAYKPSTSLPQQMSMTEDFLRASIGFQRIDTLKIFFFFSTLSRHGEI
jgi:hypothetical protein